MARIERHTNIFLWPPDDPARFTTVGHTTDLPNGRVWIGIGGVEQETTLYVSAQEALVIGERIVAAAVAAGATPPEPLEKVDKLAGQPLPLVDTSAS